VHWYKTSHLIDQKEGIHARMKRTILELDTSIKLSCGTLGDLAINQTPLFRNVSIKTLCMHSSFLTDQTLNLTRLFAVIVMNLIQK